MTLTVKLDDQDRNRLEALIVALNVDNQSDAVRKLINDRFEELQATKTLLERRGGHPEYLLSGAADLSDRTTRKAVVREKLSAKTARRAGRK